MKHSHYHKDVSNLETLDVYRVLTLYAVTDPCIQHAVKKLLVAGGRGAGKDISQDIQEAIDSLERWKDMHKEDTLYPTIMGMRYIEVPDDYLEAPLQIVYRTKEAVTRAMKRKIREKICITTSALRACKECDLNRRGQIC